MCLSSIKTHTQETNWGSETVTLATDNNKIQWDLGTSRWTEPGLPRITEKLGPHRFRQFITYYYLQYSIIQYSVIMCVCVYIYSVSTYCLCNIALEYIISFLVWPLIPILCRCKGLLLHLITLHARARAHTHTHTHVHAHIIGLFWMRDRPVADISTCTTPNTHKRQTSMPLAGFEPVIPASEWLQTLALGHATTGIGSFGISVYTSVE